MKFPRILTGLALGAIAGAAAAGPVDLGTGPDTYTFSSNHDQGFFVTLGPGAYDIQSVVSATGFDLIEVWLSYSKDHKSNNGNDIDTFTEVTPTYWTEAYGPLVLTETTAIFVDVNSHLGKLSGGVYDGRLIITPAVPEPATVPLLLAGLGLLGVVARRRRS